MTEAKGKTVGELTVNDMIAMTEEIAAQARQFAYDVNKSEVYFFGNDRITVKIYLNDRYNQKSNGHYSCEPEVSACCVHESNSFDVAETEADLRAWMQEQFVKLQTPAQRERIHLAAKLSGEAGMAQHYSPELRELWMAAWGRAMKDSGLLALVDDTDAS